VHAHYYTLDLIDSADFQGSKKGVASWRQPPYLKLETLSVSMLYHSRRLLPVAIGYLATIERFGMRSSSLVTRLP
jgi:hypothetical protein